MRTKHLLAKDAHSLIVFSPVPENQFNDRPVEEIEYLFLYNINEETEDLLQLLENIKTACKLDPDSKILVLPVNTESENPISLRTFNNLKKCLVFGLTPLQIGLNCSHTLHQPLRLGQATILFTAGLSALSRSRDIKKRLWKPLQNVFYQ